MSHSVGIFAASAERTAWIPALSAGMTGGEQREAQSRPSAYFGFEPSSNGKLWNELRGAVNVVAGCECVEEIIC